MTHGSLFSGIGGFDLAAEWMGWDNIFHCEWNAFGQRVLKYYWPNAISYEDITKTDFTIHRGRIDILTGGFPCQPYSMAGKRKGKDDERHLWPEMLRAIREIQPRWVVGENVLGLVNWNGGLVFHEVQTDLEAEGYEVWPYVLPAVSVNAPHRRDRVWFVAYRKADGLTRSTAINGWEEYKQNNWNKLRSSFDSTGEIGSTPHPTSDGFNDQSTEANNGKRIQTGQRRRNRVYNGEPSRMGSEANWHNFPTQSPICTGDDGLSSRLDGITFSKWRNESIKAGGNAIVPQVVHQIFKAIEQYDTQTLPGDFHQ